MEGRLRVFTAFSGYDSQCMALDRLGMDYDLVGWSEIDKYAIQAHDAIYPRWSDRNYGDISRVDWDNVPDFDLFTMSSPCKISAALDYKGVERKVAEHVLAYYGNAEERYWPKNPNSSCLRMSRLL